MIERAWATVVPNFAAAYGRLIVHPRLHAALLAGLVLVIIFPDVVFEHTSLRLTDQLEAGLQHLPSRSVYPHAQHREWWHGYTDAGGAIWQSEPMMEFIRYCLWTRNSPYWNPFSAAGSLGPETLVDQKFSTFTILYSALGGGSLTYNVLLLALHWFGAYFLIRTVRERFMVSTLSSAAAAVLFLLNGYTVANLGSNVSQSYLLVPFCLHTALSFADRGSPRAFGLLTIAFALLLSCTFFPTTIISLMAIFAISIGYAAATRTGGGLARRTVRVLAGQAAALATAVCMLAVLFLPLFESLAETSILAGYAVRSFYAASPAGILSLFTPSHFFESYNAMEAGARVFYAPPHEQLIIGNTVFHFGVVALCLAANGLKSARSRRFPIIASCLGLLVLSLARIFGAPAGARVVELLPVLRNIGCQYWWGAVAVPLVILVALGVENLRNGEMARVPVAATIGVGIVAVHYVGGLYGLREPNIPYKALCLAMLAALTAVVATIIFLPSPKGRRSSHKAAILAVLMLVELTADGKSLRFPVVDIFTSAPTWVTYIRQNIGHSRTMSVGRWGLVGERGSAYQIPEITSVNMGTIRGYRNFFHRAIDLRNEERFGEFLSLGNMTDTPDAGRLNWRALDLLGVKYVIVPTHYTAYAAALRGQGLRLVRNIPPVSVFENPHVLPRAFVLTGLATHITTQIALPPGFRDQLASAEIVMYRNAKVSIRGQTDVPGLLVLTDNWHGNWRADVNATPAPIVRVEGTFRGVWVPAGRFQVTMSYSPRSLPLALTLSLLTVSIVVWLVCGAWLPRGRNAGTHRLSGTGAPGPADAGGDSGSPDAAV